MVDRFSASLLALFVVLLASSATGQTSAPPAGKPTAPGLIKLTGEDEKRAKQLDEQIDKAMKADRWDEATARAEDLLAWRAKVQGPNHFETKSAEWSLKALRRVAPMPKEDRDAYRSSGSLVSQAETLLAQGKYALAQPLFEKALEISRRLLTDEHPDTATSYLNLATILDLQGKYAAARELSEKALEIDRRLLTDEHFITASAYIHVAVVLSHLGKYAEAQPLLEKALEIDRRLLGDENAQTASAYNGLAYNLNAQGKYNLAQPLFEKALEISRRLNTDEHAHTATAYNNLAFNLDAQGKYAVSQPLYEKALEIYRRLHTDLHPSTATSFTNLAINLEAQARHGQAQPLFEKALGIRRQVLTENHPDTAAAYCNLAGNLHSQGKYATAQPLYETALQIDRQLLSDNHPRTAKDYNNLALNLGALGEQAKAQPFAEKALEIDRRLLTDNHPDTANSYEILAQNLQGQGKYAAAQPLFEKGLELHRRLFTDEHPRTADSYNELAANLGFQGRYRAARPLFEKALEINRRLLTDEHPTTAVAYHNVASTLAHEGNYAGAHSLSKKALDIWRRRFADDNPLTANGYDELASILKDQGEYSDAQPLYEKALEIRRRLFGDNHLTTARTYSALAANSHAQGNYIEARERWLRAANGLNAARVRIAFTGLERVGAARSMGPPLAAVSARLGQPAEAWQALEDDMGRGLLDELAARQDWRLQPGERTRLRELTAKLETLDRLVESTPKELDKGERAKRFEELKRERDLASIALGEFQTKLVRDHGPLAGRVATLNEIQAALPADAALIAWVDIDAAGPNAADPDGEHWGVVVRSQGASAWVPLAGTGRNGLWTKDDTELASRLRTELRSQPGTGTGSADLGPLVERFRSQRMAPLDKAFGATATGLPPARRLIVLPSRAMAGIPVEALLSSSDTRTVSYAPSATVYKYLREQPRPDRHAGLLALGDPVYERPDKSSDPKPPPDHGLLLNLVVRGSNAANHGLKDGDVLLTYNGQALNKKDDLKVVAEGDKPVAVEVWRDGRRSRRDLAPGKLGVFMDPRPAPVAIVDQRKLNQALVAARGGGEDFAPLPGTRHEVEALARLFKADDRPTRALLAADASEPELDRLATAGELGRFGFIHLATHGVIDETIPQQSAVILTQTGLPDPLEQAMNQKPVFDGRLSVREIQRSWDLKAELVTLSACETALGRDFGGEGFVGFTQALLMSGARSVCLSLWRVNDKATSLLMTRFYQNLLGKRPGLAKPMPKAEALSEAKKWLRSLTLDEIDSELASLEHGEVPALTRGKGAPARKEASQTKSSTLRPYDQPYYWAAFVLVGDPD